MHLFSAKDCDWIDFRKSVGLNYNKWIDSLTPILLIHTWVRKMQYLWTLSRQIEKWTQQNRLTGRLLLLAKNRIDYRFQYRQMDFRLLFNIPILNLESLRTLKWYTEQDTYLNLPYLIIRCHQVLSCNALHNNAYHLKIKGSKKSPNACKYVWQSWLYQP